MSVNLNQSIEEFKFVPTIKPKETYEYPSPLLLLPSTGDESLNNSQFALTPLDERANLPMSIKGYKSHSILYTLINKKKVLASL